MGRHRILVVDDDPPIARVLVRSLREDAVTCCGNGREALAILAENPPFDVILCDVMMPVMNGIDLFHSLTPQQRARVIFITGAQNPSRLANELHALGAPVLHKPFTVQELRDAVDAKLEALSETSGTG